VEPSAEAFLPTITLVHPSYSMYWADRAALISSDRNNEINLRLFIGKI
jgi:hypothetical protein